MLGPRLFKGLGNLIVVVLNALQLVSQLRNVLRAKEITKEFDVLDHAILNVQPSNNRPHVEVLPPLQRKLRILAVNPVPVVVVLFVDLVDFLLVFWGNNVLLILNLVEAVNVEEPLDLVIPVGWNIDVLVLLSQVWPQVSNPGADGLDSLRGNLILGNVEGIRNHAQVNV